jgi:hypothetical protein
MSHNLADAFIALAYRFPNSPATESTGTSLTFSQLVKELHALLNCFDAGTLGLAIG